MAGYALGSAIAPMKARAMSTTPTRAPTGSTERRPNPSIRVRSMPRTKRMNSANPQPAMTSRAAGAAHDGSPRAIRLSPVRPCSGAVAGSGADLVGIGSCNVLPVTVC